MDEYADFIASLAQAAEIEKQILDGSFAPMVNVLLPIPIELREILKSLNNTKAHNLLEFGIRYSLPVLTNNPLENSRLRDPVLVIREFLEMYISYTKLFELQPYVKTLTMVIEDISKNLSRELVKYDLKNTMVTIAVVKDRPLGKNIEIMVFGNYTDPETGEWMYYA